MKRGLKIQNIEYEHYVIKKGEVFKVEMDQIDKARDFSSFGKRII